MDLEKLKKLLGDDPKMVQKFVNLYKTQMPVLLDQLKTAIATGNWEEASIAAHDIKNQSLYMGLDEIADLATQLEAMAETDQDIIPGSGILDLLQTKMNQVIEEGLTEGL